MTFITRWPWLILLILLLTSPKVSSQIDPVRRDLLQIGYNAALQGHQPISAYAFYYHNRPNFPATNLTLRLAIAPTYLDSELGFINAFGENTDFGIGLAGGGFADSYAEIRSGKYLPDESFYGHGGEVSTRLYHLFNPGDRIPLNGVLRTGARFSTYSDSGDTDDLFVVPSDRGTFNVRTGLRWGGREPTLYPDLAMSLSVWYDGQLRLEDETYGFYDRTVEQLTHNFWTEAGLVYTTPSQRQAFDIKLSLGATANPDRFSAFRLGALLPLVSEFPLSVPGYYYQEISARRFALLSGSHLYALDKNQRWNLNTMLATANVDYIEGLEQPGHWHTGVGAGILYRTDSWKMMVGYAYGVDAIRSHGRGAHSIGVLMQLDWGQAREEMFSSSNPNLWRGLQRVFGLFGQ